MSDTNNENNDIELRVKSVIAESLENVEIEDISNDASFADDLGAGSLELMEMVMQFEDDFDITISDEDSEKLTTVQVAIDYIKQRLA